MTSRCQDWLEKAMLDREKLMRSLTKKIASPEMTMKLMTIFPDDSATADQAIEKYSIPE